MAELRDQHFAEAAVAKGYVTREQIVQALGAQQDPPKPLGQLLLEKGFLTLDQLGELLEIEKKWTLDEQAKSSRSVGMFGQIALAKRWVTIQQLDDAVREQADLAKQGQKLAIGQILIRKRILSTEQFLEIMKLQEKSILQCDGCKMRYNVAGMKQGARIKCKKCGRILVVAGTDTAHYDQSITPGSAGVTDSGFLRNAGVLLARGATFGKYEILQEIGRGGMGIIFKARHAELNQTVAIKILKEGEGADARSIQRFHREAKTAARLRHPNIVSVHDVGIERGLHYIVMDLVEGESLDALLAQKGLPRDAALRVVEQAARALHHAHGESIVHRDVKPGNIMVDGKGTARIMDFGLAKALDSSSQVTRSGSAIGTPFYMPPEQVRGELDRVGPHSDIYSLGVVLYEIATGQVPFRGLTAMEVYQKILNEEPERPAVAPDLATIILKCLEKNPSARYRDAAALADDLARHLAGQEIVAQPPSLVAAGVKKIRRHRILAVAAAVAVVLIAGFVFFTGHRDRRREDGRRAEIDATLKRAEDALREGRYDDAVREFGVVAQLEPSHARAKEGAEEAARRSKEEADRRAAEDQEKKRKREVEDALSRGREHLAAGRLDDAIQEFAKADGLDPGNADAKTGADEARRRKAETERAGEIARFLQLARDALAKREYETARDQVEKAAKAGAPEAEIAPLRRRAWGIGKLSLECRPEGTVTGFGVTPLRDADLAAGSHLLEIRVASGRTHRIPVVIARREDGEGESVTIRLDLEIPDGQVFVPEGPFLSGENRTTQTTAAFRIDAREVTSAEYAKFLAALPAPASRRLLRPLHWLEDAPPEGEADVPVHGIPFAGARAYAIWSGARLPTELEWEKAARGVDGRIYPWGDDPATLGLLVMVPQAEREDTADLSPYGCRSMSGGAAEWTRERAVRGGWWQARATEEGDRPHRADVRTAKVPAAAVGLRRAESAEGSLTGEDPGARIAALSRLRPDDPAVVRAMSDPDDEVAWTAVEVFRRAGGKGWPLLENAPAPARLRAAGWLLLFGDASGREVLVKTARGLADLEEKRRLAGSLILAGDEEGLILLYEIFVDNPRELERDIVVARRGFGGSRFDRRMLDHKSGEVRACAAYCINFEGWIPEGAFVRLLEMKAKDPSATVRRWARDTLSTDDPEEALPIAEEQVRKDPDNAVLLVNRSAAFRRLGQLDNAMADANRAVQANGMLPEARQSRAYLHVLKGNPDKALADLDEAIRLRPTVGQYFASRGLILYAKKKLPEAAADFRRFLELGVDRTALCPDECDGEEIRVLLRQIEK